MVSILKLRFRSGKYIVLAGEPDIESRQQEDAHDQVRDQAADDHDGEGPLRIRADTVGHRSRKES